MKTELLGLYSNELLEYITALGEKTFRATQISQWLLRGESFSGMKNLPLSLRNTLEQSCVDQPVAVSQVRTSPRDGTQKLLYALRDGNLVEGVVMHHDYGHTLCLSTQVGCRMGCKFCASTLDGCIRSLTAAEMLGEVVCANRILAQNGQGKLGNLVLMGSGEPFDNYDQVVRFLRLVNAKDGLNLSLRSVSLSTCGLVPMIYRFCEEGLPVTLSVSLHAPNDEIRRRTMPVANAYPMDNLMAACREYVKCTGRRVIFEYTLIRDVNSLPEHARELASRLRGLQCHVNLIPLNSVPERGLLQSDRDAVEAFRRQLEKMHISATIRRSFGDDIEGACGQLRRRVLGEQSHEGSGGPCEPMP